MAAVGVEEDPVVQTAATTLLTLKHRILRRWPEWVPKEPATVELQAFWPVETWPKRQRNGNRLRRRSEWPAAMASPNPEHVAAPFPAGSGACSSDEKRERSPVPPRRRERSSMGPVGDELAAPTPARGPDSPVYSCAPAGSAPSTSADRKASTRPCHAVETAAKSPPAAKPKERMKARRRSPKTPLESLSASAAGSGTSSSLDEEVQPPSKRKAPEALGSGGGACSGDEGCSLPDKRARVDAVVDDGAKATSEPKATQAPPPGCEKGVKFEFDLNMPCPEDGEC